MDHLHLSMHGLGTVLDEISGVYGAGERQLAVIEWLSKEEWPWRMNMTLQQKNYEHINEVAAFAVNHGCRHMVALGFLPHYGWGNLDRPRAIAVHPAALRPYLDSLAEAIEIHNAYWAENQKLYLTIRYHPMCHINPKNRKYITNAKYVVYDPGEWEYDSVHLDEEALWSKAKELAGVGKHDGKECFVCGLRIHCGAWNANMINLFDGAGLSCVQTSEEENVRGYFHDQNPFNTEFKGWFE
jgi:MoaA/NifB/PqqE/SkfB family radical SAM enzyme